MCDELGDITLHSISLRDARDLKRNYTHHINFTHSCQIFFALKCIYNLTVFYFIIFEHQIKLVNV